MVDPIYVLMLANRLGPAYSVWDQSAAIDFLRPARGKVRARFEVGDDRLKEVREATTSGKKYSPVWPVEILDASGECVARASKTLYVRRRD